MFNNISLRKAREQSGQSTVEYIILVTAVVGVIILFMTGNNSIFSQKMSNTLNETTQGIKDKSSALSNSHVSTPGVTPGSQVIVNVQRNLL